MKRFITGWCVLTGTYVFTNLDLFGSVLGKGFTTHREEMTLTATENLWEKFCELFFVGGSYSNVYSKAVFCVALIICVAVWYGALGKKCADKNTVVWNAARNVQMLLFLIVVLTVCAVLWNCQMIVSLRKFIGGMVTYFQADRVYWIFPFLWMLLLATVLQVFYEWGKANKLWFRIVLLGFGVMLFAVEGYQIFRDSNFNKNIRLVLIDGYEQITWDSLYMEDVFEQIDAVVGEDKASCSVVSLGMYPSVALYNGYICADGYSNNYELEYKHAFRKIQAKELAKKEEVRKYFDEWGNRLYLISAEYGLNGMIGKNQGIAFEDLKYDNDAMRALNIKYVFAAAPITDAGEMGWTLMSGSPFASESSYYEVWVYRVDE